MSIEFYELEVRKPDYLGSGTWKLQKLTPITIIFGKNGSGKSVLLRQIKETSPAQYNYCVPERSGEISFNPQSIMQQIEPQGRSNRATQNSNPEYRQDIITRIGAFLEKRGASRESTDPNDLDLIETYMNSLLPDFKFSIRGGNPPYSLTKLSNNQNITSTSLLSSGESQLLTLGLDMLLICNMWKFDKQTGTLLIDEPDPHLHPDLQQKLAKFLVDLHKAYHCRMIISTHSTVMLSALGYHGADKTSVIYLDNKPVQEAKQFNDVLKKLSTCLGGHALMGPLFDFPLLLVEGDDDYRIWSEIPRHNTVKISVIPCNGEEIFEYQKTLEKIFSSILDSSDKPRGYALLDGDKHSSSVEQKHVGYIKLNCKESENLYLTDEILKSLNLDWATACDKVLTECHKFGNKADLLKEIKSWNRQNVDCKPVINELAHILDDKNLLWTQRLGKELGKNAPTGQLSEFLGQDLMNVIWKIN